MFGLEKGKGRALMEFDLEKELREDAGQAQKLLKDVEGKIKTLKETLRAGSGTEDFDQLGVLLHGYTALQRLLQRINKK